MSAASPNSSTRDDLLVLDHVDKRFGGLLAVGDVSFSVPRGSIFGLIGPNGAGKTTVFNVVTGVYRADGGTIRLRPKAGGAASGAPIDLIGKSPSEIAGAGVARTFQNIRLFASMNVLDNVLVAGELQRRAGLFGEIVRTKKARDGEAQIEARARSLLDAMGLSDVVDAPATSLPYGSQRRLEIARALMIEPSLLLLDEPAAGLNYGEAQSLQEQIRQLRDRFSLTIILVEHNMQVVMGVCERIHVLDHGNTIAEGTPQEVRANPKVVAAYLGEPEESAASRGDVVKIAHPTRAPADVRFAGAETPLLRIESIEVRYGGIRALKGVSLDVRRGEVVALIGSNGAGKTTTLRSLMRLVPWASGGATFAGEALGPLSTEEVVARGISLVPEGRAIFPNLVVRENLEIGAYLHRSKTAIAETIDDVVKLFPRLGERMKQEAGTLSGGEQQMLAIGRALMARPSLLLLDEPSLGIAPMLAKQIFVAIAEVARAGVTVLVVEQNTRLALGVAQRGYVLRTGEVAKEGSAKELLDDPLVREAYLGG